MLNKDEKLNEQIIDYDEFILIRSKVNELYEWYESQTVCTKTNKLSISRFEGEPISRNYRIYPNILNEFKYFCEKHKEYKVQELISQALKDFIDKYN